MSSRHYVRRIRVSATTTQSGREGGREKEEEREAINRAAYKDTHPNDVCTRPGGLSSKEKMVVVREDLYDRPDSSASRESVNECCRCIGDCLACERLFTAKKMPQNALSKIDEDLQHCVSFEV